jgi:hypothetical protein
MISLDLLRAGDPVEETVGPFFPDHTLSLGLLGARWATLAQEADDALEREHYERLRDAWSTLAKRCEPFNFPDVTDTE